MKYKYLLSTFALAGGLAFTGCSDFLDAENKSNMSSDVYFATEEGFENLSNTPYYKLRAIYGDDPAMFCSGTDLYEKGRSNYSDVTLSTYKDLGADNSNVMEFYQQCYDGIQQANAVIYYGASAAGSNVTLRVNEAKFLKAFYYYLLSQQFGAVPISKEYIASVQLSYPRSPQNEVYDYIITLLKEIETDNVLPMTDNTGRASMRAVYNLMAKTYLAYAWDYGTTANADGSNVEIVDKTNFTLAAQYADKAIDNQTPSLSFSEMWDVANDNNKDVIFAIQYTRGISGQDETTTGNRQDAHFSNYYNDEEDTKYTTSQYPASNKLLYLFEPGDERFAGTFMVTQWRYYKKFYKEPQTAATEIYGYYPAWYEDLSKIDAYNVEGTGTETTKVFSSSDPCVYVNATVNKRTGKITYKKGTQAYETTRTTTGTSICVRKFDDYEAVKNTTQRVSFHDIVLAHLTETYLLAAEAYHMAGDDVTSLKRLNVVRKRAKAAELTSYASYKRHYSDGTDKSYNSGSGIDQVPFETNLDPVDVILDERARELCGEYYRWMDLRRTKRLIDYNVKYASGVPSADYFMGPDGKYRWFRPFPQAEINLNDGIEDSDQTDGYRTVSAEEELPVE